MIIVIVVVALLAFITIPLNYNMNRKNEQVLMLFATLSPQALNSMLEPIQIAMKTFKTSMKIKQTEFEHLTML